ncbi:diguanylate cyclase [Mycobacterium sp. NBC_00419]|uniref:GGDEF domain-containing protein n=1 Tax=Mycobacterium sp. NBC_00419 TaxID=2975989 RepID=UPI002E1ACE7B
MELLASLRSVGAFHRIIGEWWREPVDYATQVHYFRRAMSGAVQVLIGLGTGLDAVLSAAILLPSASTIASRVAVAFFVAVQAFWSWVWCFRTWPSRRMSVLFVFSADFAITTMVWLDANWVLASFGLAFFSMLSVYLVFFDGPKVLAGHIFWAFITTAVFVARIGIEAQVEVVELAATALVPLALVLGTPLGVQSAIWALRHDAEKSVIDPLTGLLNRRGLHLHLGDLVTGGSSRDAHIVVMVVDLDRFKAVNDSFGHAVGDEVLIRSARRIKSAVRGGALVARVGGEEFVIVDLTEPGHPQHVTEQVLSAVAAPDDHPPITASVGVTSVAVAEFAALESDPATLLETIIGHADQAMFDAKRRGGNSAIHVRAPRPLTN